MDFVVDHFKPILIIGALLIVLTLAVPGAYNAYYTNLGFEEAEEIDNSLSAKISGLIEHMIGGNPEFSDYGDITKDDKIEIDVDGKTVKGSYYGYKNENGYHYVMLNRLLAGNKLYKISEYSCEISGV